VLYAGAAFELLFSAAELLLNVGVTLRCCWVLLVLLVLLVNAGVGGGVEAS
jgi:hypothetical protein